MELLRKRLCQGIEYEIMLPVVNSMVSRTGINGEAVSTIHYLLRTARLNHSEIVPRTVMWNKGEEKAHNNWLNGEEEAEWAVLTSGRLSGIHGPLLTTFVNGAFALLEYTNGFDTSIRPLFDDLESLAGYILLEMVSVMKKRNRF
nr:putative E3 ubiquitin-protein ligase RF298 [Ipomoea batatas]